jgi:hypothetical protein
MHRAAVREKADALCHAAVISNHPSASPFLGLGQYSATQSSLARFNRLGYGKKSTS